jgi:hypothetical protein
MSEMPPFQEAHESVDPDRLLPGEPTSTEGHDHQAIELWLGVYSELIETKESLIANLNAALEGQSPRARLELETHDLLLLEAQVGRFRQRRAFWAGRKDGLNGR